MDKQYKAYDDASAFNILDEFVYIIDLNNYDILFMNDLALKRFNMTNDKLHGKKCYEVLRGANEPCAFCGAVGMTMDSSCRWMSHNRVLNEYHQVQDTPIIYKGHEARVELSIDVTAQVMQRQKLKSALDTETAMLEALHILNDSLDINFAINKMLEYLGMCFGAKRTYIYELQDDKFVDTYEWRRFGDELPFGKGHAVDEKYVLDWLDEADKIMMPDYRGDRGQNRPFIEAPGINTSVLAKLECDGTIVGVIGIDEPLVERSDTLTVMLTTVAYFTALSMTSANNRHSLELLSYTDAMTRVANRNAFIRDVRRFKESFAISPKPVGVIYLDLNELKKINDNEGHEAGDRLIVSLADAISFFFRRSEIYRVGGDEFVVIAVGIGEATFKERITEIKRFINEQTKLSVSIGQSWTEDGTTLSNLIDDADGMMYEKKQNYYRNREDKQSKQEV